LTTKIYDVPSPINAQLLASYFFGRNTTDHEHWPQNDGWVQTLCARSALRILLLYLRETRVLADKNEQVLFPQWICNTVTQSSQALCMPTNRPTDALRAVMVYHQYGYPQNLKAIEERCAEENLLVVENSVNCVESYWRKSDAVDQSRRVGSIFSWPKLFPVVLGGALQSDLYDVVHRAIAEQNRSWKVAERMSFWSRFLCDRMRGKIGEKAVLNFQGMAYAVSDLGQRQPKSTARYLTSLKVSELLEKRKKNYSILLNELGNSDFVSHLERDIIPFVVPICAPERILAKADLALREIGVSLGIYHFDMNRNVFEPSFAKTLLLPIHPGVKEETLDKIVQIIRRVS